MVVTTKHELPGSGKEPREQPTSLMAAFLYRGLQISITVVDLSCVIVKFQRSALTLALVYSLGV